jgi:Cu/Ag efflux protein CusF
MIDDRKGVQIAPLGHLFFNITFHSEIVMTRFSHIVLACACACALPVSALAQGASVNTAVLKAPDTRGKAGAIEVRAKVIELDMAHRIATLRGPKGKLVTVDVPADVKNFDQVRVGDELVVRYVAALAATLEPVSNNGIRERIESSSQGKSAAGAMPGAAVGRTIEALMTVQAVDKKAGTVTLRGVQRTVTVETPAGIDLNKIKAGNSVRAVFTEAAVLSVERAPAAK